MLMTGIWLVVVLGTGGSGVWISLLEFCKLALFPSEGVMVSTCSMLFSPPSEN